MTRRQLSIAHSESSPGWGGQEHRILAELTGFMGRGHVVVGSIGCWLNWKGFTGVVFCAPGHAEIVERAQRAGVPVKEMCFSRLRFPLHSHVIWWKQLDTNGRTGKR
jgi:hypothetical protein